MNGSPQPHPNNSPERQQWPPEVLEVTNERSYMLDQAEQRYMAALLALRESVRAMEYQRASMAGHLVSAAQEDLHMARRIHTHQQTKVTPAAPHYVAEQAVAAPVTPEAPARNPLLANVTSLYPKVEREPYEPAENAQPEASANAADDGPAPLTRPLEGEPVVDNVVSLDDYRQRKVDDQTARQLAEARAAVAGIYGEASGVDLIDPEIKPDLVDGFYDNDWNQQEAA